MPVVDASVVVDWVAPGASAGSPAMRLLDRLVDSRASLVGPRLLFAEVANALVTGIRRQRWSGAEADDAFALLHSLPVAVVDDAADLTRAWELSRRYDQHPVYDMIYVALAERLRTSLHTADQRLCQKLARLDVSVELVRGA